MGRLGGGRRTNLALLVLLPAALASGAAAFAIGSGWVAWVVAAHGVVAFALIAVAPWKMEVSRRGLRRRSRSRTWPSVVLGALVIAVVVTGLGHSTGLLRSIGPITSMQVHVAAALASVPFALGHVVVRSVRPRRTDLSRRTVVRSGLFLAGSALVYGGVGRLSGVIRLPGSERRFTGSYEKASFDPASMPVTQWLNDRAPSIDPREWSLSVSDLGSTRAWTLEQLASFEDAMQATIDCTGGWYSTQEWEGVLLSRLLPQHGSTESIEVRSATGYARRFPASDAEHLLLAIRLGGRQLDLGHGSPARIVAPGRRGFWWVKWVTSIRASDEPWWWQPPFPLS